MKNLFITSTIRISTPLMEIPEKHPEQPAEETAAETSVQPAVSRAPEPNPEPRAPHPSKSAGYGASKITVLEGNPSDFSGKQNLF